MCSNFENITPRLMGNPIKEVMKRLQDGVEPIATNHAWPKRPATIIRASEGDEWLLEDWYWSLVPFWSKDGAHQKISTYNARSETVATAPAFRGPWRNRKRCLVPATCWYEPAKNLGRKGWASIWPSARVITFGGVWDTWKPSDDSEPLHSFAIITTEPAPSIARVHNRMPAIIPATERDRWLSADTTPDEARSLLQPVEDDYRVSLPESP